MGESGPEALNYDFRNRKRRQEIETTYLENGSFYIFTTRLLREMNNRLGGKIGFYEQEKHKMFQIDNLRDIALCEAILHSHELR